MLQNNVFAHTASWRARPCRTSGTAWYPRWRCRCGWSGCSFDAVSLLRCPAAIVALRHGLVMLGWPHTASAWPPKVSAIPALTTVFAAAPLQWARMLILILPSSITRPHGIVIRTTILQ